MDDYKEVIGVVLFAALVQIVANGLLIGLILAIFHII